MSSTSAVLVSIQAVSPVSILGGGGGAAAARQGGMRRECCRRQHGSRECCRAKKGCGHGKHGPHSASSPVSLVRMRTVRRISLTKILPSPILPV